MEATLETVAEVDSSENGEENKVRIDSRYGEDITDGEEAGTNEEGANATTRSVYKYHEEIYAQWFQTLHNNQLKGTLTDAQYQVDIATNPTVKERVSRALASLMSKVSGGRYHKPRKYLTASEVKLMRKNIAK